MQDEELRISGRELTRRLGGHPAGPLGLDLDAPEDADLGRWLLASVLLGGRTPEPVALAAGARLAEAGLAEPDALAEAALTDVEACLEAVRFAKPEPAARLLQRVARGAAEAGSLDALGRGADGLEELAARLSALATGFGRAAIARFLTPLRDHWAAAADLPCEPAVCAAGAHLGFLPHDCDPEAAPGILARALGQEPAPVPLRDVEAALGRLGRRACLRERGDRCPLDAACPLAGPRSDRR